MQKQISICSWPSENITDFIYTPILVTTLSKGWVYGSSLAGIAGLNPSAGMEVCFLCVLCDVR